MFWFTKPPEKKSEIIQMIEDAKSLDEKIRLYHLAINRIAIASFYAKKNLKIEFFVDKSIFYNLTYQYFDSNGQTLSFKKFEVSDWNVWNFSCFNITVTEEYWSEFYTHINVLPILEIENDLFTNYSAAIRFLDKIISLYNDKVKEKCKKLSCDSKEYLIETHNDLVNVADKWLKLLS